MVPFLFDPSPAALWTLTNGEKLASCEIAFVPIGVKATVMRNGKLLYSRIFATGDEATAQCVLGGEMRTKWMFGLYN